MQGITNKYMTEQTFYQIKLNHMEAIKATSEEAIGIKSKEVKAFGTDAADALLQQLNIERRKPTPHDVEIEILYILI